MPLSLKGNTFRKEPSFLAFFGSLSQVSWHSTYEFNTLRVVSDDEKEDVATEQRPLRTAQAVRGLQLVERYVVGEQVARSQHPEKQLKNETRLSNGQSARHSRTRYLEMLDERRHDPDCRACQVGQRDGRTQAEHVLNLAVVLWPRRHAHEEHGAPHRVPDVNELLPARLLEYIIDDCRDVVAAHLVPSIISTACRYSYRTSRARLVHLLTKSSSRALRWGRATRASSSTCCRGNFPARRRSPNRPA